MDSKIKLEFLTGLMLTDSYYEVLKLQFVILKKTVHLYCTTKGNLNGVHSFVLGVNWGRKSGQDFSEQKCGYGLGRKNVLPLGKI